MGGDSTEQRGEMPGNALSRRIATEGASESPFDLSGLESFLAWTGREADGREAALSEFAGELRALVRAMAVMIQSMEAGDLRLVGVSVEPSRQSESSRWLPPREAVAAVLESGRPLGGDIITEGGHHARLMIPVASPEEAALCISVILDPARADSREVQIAVIRLATLALTRRDALARCRESEATLRQATLLVEMLSLTARAENRRQSLQVLALQLEKFFGCQRVAIGTGSASHCQVQAISGLNVADKRSLGHSQLASAMREAIALEETTLWPMPVDPPRDVSVSSNQDDLLHSFKAGWVLVLPLREETMGFRGALALLGPIASPGVDPRVLRLLKAGQPQLGALVALLRSGKPGPLGAGVRKFWNSGPLRRAAVLGGVLAGVGLLLWPVHYRVTGDCRVEPLFRRTIAAPFESRLEKSHVKPGESVTKDQILAELDGREIRVALAEAIAARNAALKKRDNAMVLSDAAELQMAQLEADRLDLEVRRLQFRSDHLIIRSPIEGVVLMGDLERSEGVPVSPGQKLFEIAPLEGMILEVSVPDREVGRVDPGMPVHYRLEADGGRKRLATLDRIHPDAEAIEQQHVFIAEARLENADGFLRPGMKGTARVLSAKKPLGWVFFHGLWEYLRLKLW